MAAIGMRMQMVGEGPLKVSLLVAGPAIDVVVKRTTLANAYKLLAKIRENASTGVHAPGEGHIPGTGPGPNIATGEYLASWQVDSKTGPTLAYAAVSTDAPQARRLELGFDGTDSLGRIFHQPAYPHVGPAADEIEHLFRAEVEAAVDKVIL